MESDSQNTESLSSSLVATASYTWMPISTNWYTYRLSDAVSVTPVSTIISIILLKFSGPWSVAVSVAGIVKDYHTSITSLRYKHDWKMKKQYCGAQGYYGKYCNKYWHYTIDGVYIPGTYSLYENL